MLNLIPGNYYESQKDFKPVKFLGKKDYWYFYKDLITNKESKLNGPYFSPIPIIPEHLKRIGFLIENQFQSFYSYYLLDFSFFSIQDRTGSTSFKGYKLVHENNLDNFVEDYDSVRSKPFKEIEKLKIEELGTLSEINELFEKIEEKIIKLDDSVKSFYLTGIQ
ncbi:hypothetical protein [Mesonia sp. K4-1]|uniref:hypothetical protein n=1 Tax=Mesonia sp. K4-1 TaxID=2602760 RepID=UPI0011C7AF5F|nr:hypothetical protein [Mesonia sp. K4-1]TXK78691.1 hypothetical protein FT986_02540 [Mesonia sp. K4-1]